MCGIVGCIGDRPAAPLLLAALRQLEYRGYDSAGIATLAEGRIDRRRAQGKVDRLAERLCAEPLEGGIGVAHTRWATHGLPSERNAHPIATPALAMVHNGIIENHRELRGELLGRGHQFHTETDTKAAALLLDTLLAEGLEPLDAVDRMLGRLQGSFALAMLFAGRDDFLICARRGSPLAIGYGEGAMYAGSDALALAPMTRDVAYLEDGDWAVVTHRGAEIFASGRRPVSRAIKRTGLDPAACGKGSHPHYMRKEIAEQPLVVRDTLLSVLNAYTRTVELPANGLALAEVERVVLVACGTSFHAGLIASYWIDALAGVPAGAEIASEFRYRSPRLGPGTLVVGISQSGETADTLAALRHARDAGVPRAGLVNQAESSIAREVDVPLRTLAGPEIGVASTKAFTTQLVMLAAFAVALARAKRRITREDEQSLVAALTGVADTLEAALEADGAAARIARRLAASRDVLYVGRGTLFPIALEGALKLKEISYVHAEGYAAGELKHGPIALIEPNLPVVVLAPPGELFAKTISNMEEVRARGGEVILISDRAGIAAAGDDIADAVAMPDCHPLVMPIVYAVAVQLLAYHAALERGTDVDQPRNLAKSVTVE